MGVVESGENVVGDGNPSTILQADVTPSANISSSNDGSPTNDSNDIARPWYKQPILWGFLLLLAGLIAMIVALVVTRQSSEAEEEAYDVPPPTLPMTPTMSPTISPTRARDNVYEEIGARLAPITPGGIDTLLDTGTPYNRAFQWLVYEDGLELQPTANHLHQRYALMAVYFSGGKQWGNIPWGMPVHECEWDGISCVDKSELEQELDGYVEDLFVVGRADGIAIDAPQQLINTLELSQLSLDTVPEELSLLYYMQHLDLRNNNMVGTLPTPIYELVNLQTLNLAQNQWTDIDDRIGELIQLERLDLYQNEFQGPLPDSLRRLTQLKSLYLHSNQFTGEVFDILKDLNQLEIVDLAFNKFEGTIPTELGNMKHLTQIYLGENNFRGTIPNEIAMCTNLTHFQMDGCLDMIGEIPLALGQLLNLEFIKLDTCSFNGTLPTSLGNLNKLEYLDVSSNDVSGVIPTQLGDAQSLKTLGLANNDFEGDVPSELGKLTSLEKLYLQGTDLEGAMPVEVCALQDRGNETVLEVLWVPCDVECDAGCCTNCS